MMISFRYMLLLFSATVLGCSAFISKPFSLHQTNSYSALSAEKEGGGLFQGIKNMFEELDAFMDDASARRLGNGAAFYGKRRSNFYGEKDKNKKKNRSLFDPTEDYQGPSQSGYFKWMPDENGQMRPVTRMKEKIVERRGVFAEDNEE